MLRTRPFATACAVFIVAAGAPTSLQSQSLEGSKWSIEQEGASTPVLWWLGSQGRVRTGDVGTILSGYRWVQKEDSVIVTVGDTLRYAGMLMSNRLVGVRSAGRQEGWWSGMRLDTASAVVTTPPIAPPSTDPGSENMARQADPAVIAPSTPPSRGAERPAGSGRRQIRRIERAGGEPAATPTPAPGQGGEGREIRRLPRPGARAVEAAELPPSPAIPPERFAGVWERADTGGVIERLEVTADGGATIVLASGHRGAGSWVTGPEGTTATFVGEQGGGAVIRFWEEGGELRGIITTATGVRRTWHFRRIAGADGGGAGLEPATPARPGGAAPGATP